MRQPAIYPGLAGKTVFITGGGSGIGAAHTAGFVGQKAKVAFVDIAEGESRALVEKIAAETGNKPLFIPCDIRDIKALQAAIEKTRAELGDISVLVNNAANDRRHTVEEVSVEYWEDGMAINFRPHFFAAQAVLPMMKRLGGGSIINFSSLSRVMKTPLLPTYIAAKAGIVGLTRALAREFGAFNIRVNSVTPGWVLTEKQVKLWLTPEGDAERLKGQCLPVKLMADDLADMVLFLASDASSKCTAQDFIVDCGWG